MIEKIIYDYLTTALNTGGTAVNVYMERPEKPVVPFIVIEKTGTSEKNMLRRSIIAIQCYGASLYLSASLAETVINSMVYGLVTLKSVASVKLNNSYNFTKTDSKEYRYQAVFEVYWYQEEITNEQ